MNFESSESLANHKANFCIDSDWVDPEVMKRQLENEEAGGANGGTRELSFDEVKSYLKRRATGEETGFDRVCGKSIQSLRDTFNKKGGEGLEEMHRIVMTQRAQEKAEELRKLKIRQQKIRAQRNQDEREIRDLMRDLEKRKEVELRARMEREVVKRELRNLDAVQLKSIESERKQEIAQLAREREQLKMREDELLAEVAKLEDRITNREKSFKQQQNQVEDYYLKNLNQKKDAHKNEQMQLAQYRGQRSTLSINLLVCGTVFERTSRLLLTSSIVLASCLFLNIGFLLVFTMTNVFWVLAASRTMTGLFQIFLAIYQPCWADVFGNEI
jgi:hypothetical protein